MSADGERELTEVESDAPQAVALARRTEPVRYVCLHHWGGHTPTTREGMLAEARAQGYADIPYHYVILPDGAIITGRPLWAKSAAQLGLNHCAIGVCFAGNFDQADNPGGARGKPTHPTDAQLASAGALWAQLKHEHPQAQLIEHRDVARVVRDPSVATACPGSRWEAERCGRVVQLVAGGLSVPDARTRAREQR